MERAVEAQCAGCPNTNGDETVKCKGCMNTYHVGCVVLPGTKKTRSWDRWLCTVCKGSGKLHVGNTNSPAGKPCSASATPSPSPGVSPADTPVHTPRSSPTKKKKPAETAKLAVPASGSLASRARAAVAAAPAPCASAEDDRAELRKDVTRLAASLAECRKMCEALRDENARLVASLEFLHGQREESAKTVKGLEERIDRLEGELSNSRSASESQASVVATLESRVEEGEQRARLNNIEIFGVPEREAEDLRTLVMDIGKVAGVTVRGEDLDFATRVTPRRSARPALAGRPRPIVVKFNRREQKEDLIRAIRKRRGVSTTDVGIGGDKANIYVNEHLTPFNKALFGRARVASREAGFRYCWVAYNKVYVRRSDRCPALRMRTMADVMHLASKKS